MSESSCGGFTCFAMWQRLKRKKQLEGDSVSRLDRCLTIPDLTLLSVGAMMGVGIYVLSGQVSFQNSESYFPSYSMSFSKSANTQSWRKSNLLIQITGFKRGCWTINYIIVYCSWSGIGFIWYLLRWNGSESSPCWICLCLFLCYNGRGNLSCNQINNLRPVAFVDCWLLQT